MKMVPHKAFACPFGEGNVVLRESHQPHTREERVCLLAGSLGASTAPSYSARPSTPPSYSPKPSRNAECSNCKLLTGKIKVFEATLEMYMHSENHTLDSTALLHELYNDMRKFGLE
ncbi:hypothetical protein Tco_0993067 [Tanacetum coccineum]|uniref:Uncharacterized protein n=1 Tax=Tanacetum coccineum TaxID=301880 RepID=A0ABQ5F4K6_9ASTR